MVEDCSVNSVHLAPNNGYASEYRTHGFSKPVTKFTKDHSFLTAYRNLVKRINFMIHCQRFHKSSLRQEYSTKTKRASDQENVVAFVCNLYEGFQEKDQTVAIVIDLGNAYNRVQFKFLMDLLMRDGVSWTFIRWIAVVLLNKTDQLPKWSSATHQLTMGLPQGSPLSLVFYNERSIMYIKGLADVNQDGFNSAVHSHW